MNNDESGTVYEATIVALYTIIKLLILLQCVVLSKNVQHSYHLWNRYTSCQTFAIACFLEFVIHNRELHSSSDVISNKVWWWLKVPGLISLYSHIQYDNNCTPYVLTVCSYKLCRVPVFFSYISVIIQIIIKSAWHSASQQIFFFTIKYMFSKLIHTAYWWRHFVHTIRCHCWATFYQMVPQFHVVSAQ